MGGCSSTLEAKKRLGTTGQTGASKGTNTGHRGSEGANSDQWYRLWKQKIGMFSKVDSKEFGIRKCKAPPKYNVHLLVEDSDSNRQIIKMYLDRVKIKTDEAPNGIIAFNKIQQGNKYDIIWMDVNMPHMSGIETAQKIREFGYDGVIIAISGNVDNVTIGKCMKSGMDDFLSKPVLRQHLYAKITDYIAMPEIEESFKVGAGR